MQRKKSLLRNRECKSYEYGKYLDGAHTQGIYTYDDNGNRSKLAYTSGGFGTNYSYNLANQVTNIDNFNTGRVQTQGLPLSVYLPDYDYEYNLQGMQTKVTDNQSGVVKSYAYDKINRLITEAKEMNSYTPEALDSLKGSESVGELLADYSLGYSYDDYGNIETKVEGTKTTTYTYDKNNRITKEEVTDTDGKEIKLFVYDKNGNTISERSRKVMTISGDTSSSLTKQSPSVKLYTYNLMNQQVEVISNSGITSYTYNASGLRDTKTAGDSRINFYWDGKNLVGESENDTLKASYIYGIGLLSRLDKTTSEKLYYMFNGHGDVVALVNDYGEALSLYDYNAHGEFTKRGLDKANPLTYFGQYYDEETGSYYLRARYYNPGYMSFIINQLVT